MQKLSKIPYLLIFGVLFAFGIAFGTGADIKDSIPIFDFHLSLDIHRDNGVQLHGLADDNNSELFFSETEEVKDNEEDDNEKEISFNFSIPTSGGNHFPSAVANSIYFSIPFQAKKYLLFHSLKIDC